MDPSSVILISSLVGAIPPSVLAYVALSTGRRNAKEAREAREAAKAAEKAADKKVDTIIEKTTEIHTLANSQLTAVTTALQVANERISGLEKMIAAIAAAPAVKTRAKKAKK